MPKKNLQNEKKKSNESDNEWSHIKTGDGYQSKISDADAIGVQDRKLPFNFEDVLKEPIPTTEVVREELQSASKESRDADQYVKYVNAFLSKRLTEIKEIQQKKKRFDAEVEALKPSHLRTITRLSKIPINQLNSREAALLLNSLSQERENIVMRLEHYKGKVVSTMNILEIHDKKMNDIYNHLQKMVKDEKEGKIQKSVETMHAELKSLGELYGIENLADALNTLKDSKEKKNG